MIVPGGGLAKDGSRWVSCKPNFCLPVRVLSKLFRRLMLTKLAAAHAAGKLQFFGTHAHLAAAKAFAAFLAPLGFHRIRHYSLFASTNRTETIEAVRKLLDLAPSAAEQTSGTDPGQPLAHSCPHCGGRMVIIDTFDAGCQPRHRPTTPLGLLRIDTS